jgi:Dyp-type peroxidase family
MHPLLSQRKLINFSALRQAVYGPPVPGPYEPAVVTFLHHLFGNMQGNILKAHGRPYAALVMFRLTGSFERNRAFLRSWERDRVVTSTWQQLNDQWDHKLSRLGSDALILSPLAASGAAPFCTLGITATGLEALGPLNSSDPLPMELRPAADTAFSDGMEATFPRKNLGDLSDIADDGTKNDPWSVDIYRDQIDVVALLAHATLAGLQQLISSAEKRSQEFFGKCPVGIEKGFTWKPPGATDFKEPFGFSDGMSNPVFFREDAAKQEGPPVLAALEKVIYAEDLKPECLGASYLVFRKLEQDVAQFKEFEIKLEEKLRGLVRPDPAAVLIGRHRSGQPLIATEPGGRNDFSYAEDGLVSPPRCPFHAHIRKTNPRQINDTDVVLVRRSLVYAPDGTPSSPELRSPCGLLFLAYMASVRDQFRNLQEKWIMSGETQERKLDDVGVDPLLAPAAPYTLRYGPLPEFTIDRPRLVTPRGGRYCFIPPLSWLRALP